jgi:hypothetical protein
MSSLHQKKLQSIQEKIKTLQDEQVKTEQILGASLLKALQTKQALSLDMNTLIGGFFSVIDKMKKGDPETEQWNKIGKQYLNKNSKSPPLENT